VPASLHSGMKERLLLLAERMRQWLATWDEGHLLREGALVVIGGCPNVGKSTLLNCLVGKERAIVTAVPGTTRDTIEEHMVLGGVPLRLVDTAGIREAQGEVERKGVERAKAAMNRADLILYVMDGSRPLSDDDIPRLTELAPKKCVVVLNKADIGVAVRAQDVPGFDVASCSLLKREGLGRIVELISTKMGIDTEAPPHAVIAERHRVELEQATREMVDAIEALSSNREDWVPLVASNVRRAMGCIGRVTGSTHSDDILDSVFGRFCIGK
jgi:tRNA modification GTPase